MRAFCCQIQSGKLAHRAYNYDWHVSITAFMAGEGLMCSGEYDEGGVRQMGIASTALWQKVTKANV